MSLNFDNENLFGFETFSLCNFRDLIYARTACNTPKRKPSLKSHYMTPLNSSAHYKTQAFDVFWLVCCSAHTYHKDN